MSSWDCPLLNGPGLKRGLCSIEMSTILNVSLTMAAERADVQAAHICGSTHIPPGLLSRPASLPLPPTPTQ